MNPRPNESSAHEIDVSVVIPVLNVEGTIGQQLKGLADQDFTGQWEVIIADNGSTDGTREMARSFADRLPGLRIVDASARKGINHARNTGAEAANGSVILFCDGDDVVSRGWVSALSAGLRLYDGVGGPVQPTHFEAATDGQNDLLDLVDPMGSDPPYFPHPIGANCGVKRQVWLTLGGFDEDYDGGGADEIEFFWRLQLADYRLGRVPEAIVQYRKPVKRNLRKSFRAAREQVHLHRDFSKHGYSGPSTSALRAWAWIVLNTPLAMVSKRRRERWSFALVRRLGRISGSIKYRHLVL